MIAAASRATAAAWIIAQARRIDAATVETIGAEASTMRTVLCQLGLSFEALIKKATITLRYDAAELAPDAPINHRLLQSLFRQHQSEIPLADHPMLGRVLAGLAKGRGPSAAETERIQEIRRTLRRREAGRDRIA